MTENTIDFTAYVYPSDENVPCYRWQISTTLEFPDCVDLSYEEYNHGLSRWETKQNISSIPKTEWDKLNYAASTIFNVNK